MAGGAAKAAGVLVLVIVAAAAVGVASGAGRTSSVRCELADPARASAASVAGYDAEQLGNAATIMDTATGMGLGRRAQVLGVMAAMGESSLRNLPYGDYETSGALNPDGTPTTSIGLFQQQDWWGTPEQRMDPAQSAALFFGRLIEVDGWAFLPPSQAIHEVQRNTDPGHYDRWRSDAEEVSAALREPCTDTVAPTDP